ncbi:MAG: Ig-like domain-containing protein [Aurantibacter sp.]
MKFPHLKIIQLIVPFYVFFALFSCSKDTDLLADYVISESPHAIVVRNLAADDTFFSYGADTVVIDVLSNDTFIDPDKAVIVKTSNPANGVVVINENRSLIYTPNEASGEESGSSGNEETVIDSFTYTTEVVDENEETTTVEATVTVKDSPDYGELKAFPTAYGGGSNTSGARGAGSGATVYVVSNLNDSGPGSFKDAVSKSNRYIVFSVSGTIDLSDNFNSNANNLTIAGQTAPAGGITITGEGYNTFQGDNIIIRHLTFRPDFITSEADGTSMVSTNDFIVDHCSVSWGTDEIMSAELICTDGTFSRNLFAEGNKTGMLLGGSTKPRNSQNLSAHNNLWYNISHRFPNVNGHGRSDVINNVVYNWEYRLVRAQGGGMQLNHINNYYFRQRKNNYNKTLHKFSGGETSPAPPKIYTQGNLILPGILTDPNADNWFTWTSFGNWSYGGETYTLENSRPLPASDFKVNTPYPLIGHDLPIKSAAQAFNDVTSDVGNNKRIDESGNVIPQVDDIDAIFLSRIVNDSPVDYGGYQNMTYIPNSPHYKAFQNSVSSTPVNTHPSDYDTDKDGMPDEWEIIRGFDPNKQDFNEDLDGNGYTNLEEFINLVDF